MDNSPPGFRLETGSTGFYDVGVPLSPRLCRAAWYAAARAAHGQVGAFAERRYPENFHSATIDNRGGTYAALFHVRSPLVAFVDELRDWYTDEFVDPPAWAVSLNHFGFTVLSASLLKSPLEKADTAALAEAEWEQIKYWQPETLGATLFNSWD
ncbi:hypothetical protein ABZ897_30430 [Nonomuraea sp. NPDC046802]|uniref:hypothetical protein n=1 Tax=Nonomuraea sp. NPDC046802 TaxID=3154919 RepID=UPI0033FE7BF3